MVKTRTRRHHRMVGQIRLTPPKFHAELRYRITGEASGFSANIVVRNGVVAEVDVPDLVCFVGQGSHLIHLHAARNGWRTELIGFPHKT
jgi:hypothetical protein